MILLYNISIFFYNIFVRIASLFNEKARLFVKGRRGWQANLRAKADENARYIWFHCASLGEFEQGRPVIEQVKKQFPGYKIALTFFSPSGYEIRKNYQQADVVAYLPLDTKRNATAFLDILKPEKAFFVKYEFWYHFMKQLNTREIPLYIVSAIFRENQQFFRNTPWGKWYRKMLYGVEHFFVQNEKSGELLKGIGIGKFTISGDTRFDRVAEIASGAKQFPIVEKFRGDSLLVVAGSTWKPDEELLAEFINNHDDIKFIIAPHEVSASNINRIHQLLKKPAVLFSRAEKTDINSQQVLIIDSIGILSSLYQYGSIAYIGGGFGVGIHNILEAATFGMPVVFGPNYKKFKEAVDLKSEGGAFPIVNYNQLNDIFTRFLSSAGDLQNASATCKKYVEKNTGSTKLIIKKVFNK